MTHATIPFCVTLKTGVDARLYDIEGEADIEGGPSYWAFTELRSAVFGSVYDYATIDGTDDLADAVRAAIKAKLLADAEWCARAEDALRQADRNVAAYNAEYEKSEKRVLAAKEAAE